MATKISQKQILGLVKEEITKLKESGFDMYDQNVEPVTKQQQIDASWNEFDTNNKNRIDRQHQLSDIESYLDTSYNTTDFQGKLGMDALSSNPDIARQGQMATGTPRNMLNKFNDYEKQKYGESKNRKMSLKRSQLENIIKECVKEAIIEHNQKSINETYHDDYGEISNMLDKLGWAYTDAYPVINQQTGQEGTRYVIETYPNNLNHIKPVDVETLKAKMTEMLGEGNVIFSQGQHKNAPEIKNLSMVVVSNE